MIRYKLGLSKIKLYARSCIIKKVSKIEKDKFLESNHLQGNCSSSINLGLYYNNELVALMTFGKARFSKKYDWELLRFCSKRNTNIVGSASRLLSYFRNFHSGSIISYANKRWSNGNLYEKLGFTFLHESKPNYFYFYKNTVLHLESRNKYQKHKLKDKLEIFDESKTEVENMKMNGYNRIFDCGNLVYIYN